MSVPEQFPSLELIPSPREVAVGQTFRMVHELIMSKITSILSSNSVRGDSLGRRH